MSTKKELYKQSETVVIWRSEINFAPYNPRIDDPEVVKTLKNNFKKVAFMGGVVWNLTTKNLVSGHKRVMGLDVIHQYDGTKETDYEIKVERVELDEKTEKEQNIFMNSGEAQGKFDWEKLSVLLPEIDIKAAAVNDEMLNMVVLAVPGFEFGQSSQITDDFNDLFPSKQQTPIDKNSEEYQQRKQKTIEAKQAFKNSLKTDAADKFSYVTISFDSHANKAAFMERFGFDEHAPFIKGEIFNDMIERIS